MEPKIIFEDQDIIVVDKPSGMTVNKADTTRHEITLQDWLETNKREAFETMDIDNNEDFIKRMGIVHRLDKETSGILLCAKNIASFKNLQSQFKERIVKKTYQALVHGKIIPPEGEIQVPVGRLTWNRKRFGVVAGGRDSFTKYSTTAYYILQTKQHETLSLLSVSPLTGRTHQIRVHLKYLQHPIFSDELYGGRKTAREDRKLLHRLFLHAGTIIFTHPKTNISVTYTSQLPQDLISFLENYAKISNLAIL